MLKNHFCARNRCANAGLAADRNGALERRLYVTDKTGISVFDIDNGHKLVHKIELPGTGDTKASPPARNWEALRHLLQR